jgi:hypothetical protein
MLVSFSQFTKPNDHEKVSSWFSMTPNFLTTSEAENLKDNILKKYENVRCWIESNESFGKWILVEFYSEADEAAFLFHMNSGEFIV